MSTTITEPADAMRVYPWEERDGQPVRPFRGSSWVIARKDADDVHVLIEGVQSADGIVRTVVVGDIEFTVGQARQLADALTAAVDEAERMASYDAI
ncbi:MAG TPA: hypothetical protein VFR17_08695, partial [Mycobacterium sp.]|nr:hypothetical protein [Mycobacterium sp.]